MHFILLCCCTHRARTQDLQCCKDRCLYFCRVWTCVTAIISCVQLQQCCRSFSLAEVLFLLPLCDERLLCSVTQGAPSLPLPFAHWVTHSVFARTQRAVTASSSCLLVDDIKTDKLRFFPARIVARWLGLAQTCQASASDPTHLSRSTALWWNTHTLITFFFLLSCSPIPAAATACIYPS